jgi:hypothetical protein
MALTRKVILSSELRGMLKETVVASLKMITPALTWRNEEAPKNQNQDQDQDQDTWHPGCHTNPGSPIYEPGMLTTVPSHRLVTR